MAHHTEQTGFPAVPLEGGMTLRLRALSPTADAAVTGVTSTQWAVYARDLSELPEEPTPVVEELLLPQGD